MVTMSTEVDKTQATIANAMAQKVENTTTSLNGGAAAEEVTMSCTGVGGAASVGLNNGSLNIKEKMDVEKPITEDKKSSHLSSIDNKENEVDGKVTPGHAVKDSENPPANALPATKTTTEDKETVTTVQITATTTTTTETTTPTNTANKTSESTTKSTTPTITASTPSKLNNTTTTTTTNCSSTSKPPSTTTTTCNTPSSTTAQQQTLLPSSIQINKVNTNAATSSASTAGASSGANSSGSSHHQRNQQQSHHQGTGGQGQQPPPPSSSSSQHCQLPSHSGNVNHSKNKNEDAPNILVYKKMEAIVEKMQAESTGVSVRTVKGFMTKVPSVFTGADLISWILKNLDVEDVTEALHFAHLLASHGYIFPIDDHQLTVKNDGTFYRFQTPYFWPSNCWEPENTDYAVYLCKRTMQNKTRLELADYEAENLAKLQKMFSRKWEFIFMQAESQSKVAKKRDKLERKVLDSQERAFWDVHRPMPGCVNTTEIDIKKAYRRGASSHGTGSGGASVAKNPIELLTRIITLRKQKLERRTIKVSKAAEALVSYYEQYNEFDYFITSPDLPNPWQTDSTEMWDAEKNSKEVSMRRCKRWAFSMRELLKDPMGREQFAKFLEKEYSYENLLFWESVQEMKALPQSEIKETIQRIWQEFLAPDAPKAVNVDSKSVELAREAVNSPNGPNRWCFDVAAAHVYHLMERDSYPRYLRSDMYKDYINCSRKKIKSIPNLFGVKR
ncbi:regulator of G-protein signaling 7-like [Musca vetustissima]|uniref:regulator of G-protein signaling 7-like n=1 Tax=Musca vetustissima TaxID=27455 RepID=UPI002AB6EC05|nr:regulator of G-protein signaling 7-like [Musca vetustissima]